MKLAFAAYYPHPWLINLIQSLQQNGNTCYLLIATGDVNALCSGFKIGNVFDRTIHQILSNIAPSRRMTFSVRPTASLLNRLIGLQIDRLVIADITYCYLCLPLLAEVLGPTSLPTMLIGDFKPSPAIHKYLSDWHALQLLFSSRDILNQWGEPAHPAYIFDPNSVSDWMSLLK